MGVTLTVVKIVFTAAFSNMLSKWNAPIGKAPESKNCLRNSCLPSLCPGGLHRTLEYYRLWGAPSHCYFMQMKLFLPLQSTSPYKSWSVFAVFILISMALIILSFYTLQESPLIYRGYEVAVTVIRPPGPWNIPICSLEVSRWLVVSAIF